MDEQALIQLRKAVGAPAGEAILQSRRRMETWFAQTAPLVRWDTMDSPMGRIYLAASVNGLCSVDFGVSEDDFIKRLDTLAHVERNPAALALATRQLSEYFAGQRTRFDVPLDLGRLTSFQQNVLRVTRTISAGKVWTYRQVAEALGKPGASRPVGQALGHNPVPIVIPCHRVIASDGGLGGYSAGAGLDSKRWLLQWEGALLQPSARM